MIPEPLRLICDAVSPPLDYASNNGESVPEVRFRCQKPEGHSGDHWIRLEWSRDLALLYVHPWRIG